MLSCHRGTCGCPDHAAADLLLAENERLLAEIQALRAQQEAQASYSLMEEEGEVPR